MPRYFKTNYNKSTSLLNGKVLPMDQYLVSRIDLIRILSLTAAIFGLRLGDAGCAEALSSSQVPAASRLASPARQVAGSRVKDIVVWFHSASVSTEFAA